ncbi:uncharacterized protein MKK02DRAFT_44995 [Dioszegia hungarica]|uniref:Uncharacterized protein n=1 Tax=Dioszegia hungarica TaxID=4972 RepID=A0AA38H9U0_9TREE|nr:uncharacterized protein MKK02DRAFT_44995 [Dioszegia hungarica]KAI9636290.1 hypothetical protein MKK02DRAFT_44995 [Dioszegia hungarica]
MNYTNPPSWFNSPSLPSSSILTDPPASRSAPSTQLYSISPPIPHRRAPPPPRRRRARHLRLLEPSTRGLFTLLEVDEAEDAEIGYRCGYACSSASASVRMLSARPSSEALSLSPLRQRLDLPQDVGVYSGDEEDLVVVENRLSWVSASSATGETSTPPTPSSEHEDPFFVDVPLDVDESDIDTSFATFLASCAAPQTRTRRPPPLDLSRSHPYAYSAEIDRWSHDVEAITPKISCTPPPPAIQPTLLPSLPILSPAAYQAQRDTQPPPTPHAPSRLPPQPRWSQRKSHSAPAPPLKKDPFDLLTALENLLATCGEPEPLVDSRPYSAWSDDSDSDSEAPKRTYQSFPLPPPRTPLLSPASASSTSSFGIGGPATPRTPRFHASLPPASSAREQKKRVPIKPRFMADHSALFSMSGAIAPIPLPSRHVSTAPAADYQADRPDSRGSGGSRGSGSSRNGRLPPRSRLPTSWTRE